MKILAGTLVLVEWEDIQSHGDWNDEPDTMDTATIQTSGWVAKDFDRRYRKFLLAGSRSVDEDTLHDHTAIPSGCILSVRSLETGRELFDTGANDD